MYHWVRDTLYYDPYDISLRHTNMKASNILQRSRLKGFCIEKSIVMAALCRAAGIPARLVFFNVRNHIGVERLVAMLKTDVIVFHGCNELLLDGKWVKCTPPSTRTYATTSAFPCWNLTESRIPFFKPTTRKEMYLWSTCTTMAVFMTCRMICSLWSWSDTTPTFQRPAIPAIYAAGGGVGTTGSKTRILIVFHFSTFAFGHLGWRWWGKCRGAFSCLSLFAAGEIVLVEQGF